MSDLRTEGPSHEGWQAFSLSGQQPIGVVLSHGFTSGPGSMAHLAARLHQAGLHVECPLLPGHGTRWQDIRGVTAEDWVAELARAADRLRERTDQVFVAGLSLGGSLVLRLAQTHPGLSGVVAINHALIFNSPLVPLAGYLKYLVPSTPAIAGDIKDPEAFERAYDRTPTAGVEQLHRLSGQVQGDWARLTQPLLVFKSREDHVLPVSNATLTMERAASSDKELVWLENSYHVATVDYDKDVIADRTFAFIQRVTGRKEAP